MSGPVLMAAALRRIPRAIQEQNALPGSTTRLLAPRVHQIHLGFDEARKYLKTKAEIHNHGNPVAPTDQDPLRKEIIEKWNLHPELPTVLITGGSQGARSINQAVQGILVELLSVANVIWQTGFSGFPVRGADPCRTDTTGYPVNSDSVPIRRWRSSGMECQGDG